jgi:hypothetical protein
MKMKRNWLVLCLLMLVFVSGVSAQDGTATVPDVTGMNVPQAAAALNAVGLKPGLMTNGAVTETQVVNTVVTQTPAAGAQVAAGSAVDLQIARPNNVRLLYDDNDLTLINLSRQALPLGNIVLRQADGDKRFRGERWGNQVRAGDCVQVWSVGRGEPKSVPDCRRVNSWLTTNDTAQHVWTTTSGVQNFNVMQDGQQRAQCQAAPGGTQDSPLVCEFYVESAASDPTLAYIYLAYTTDALVVRNPSEDSWLRLNVEVTPAGGEQFLLNRAALYDVLDPLVVITNPNGVSVVPQIAPNQCLLFRAPDVPLESMPQPCMMVGNRTEQAPFWQSDFLVRDRENKDRTCKAATPGRLTICIMPR